MLAGTVPSSLEVLAGIYPVKRLPTPFIAHPVVAADMTVVLDFVEESNGTHVVVGRKPIAYN